MDITYTATPKKYKINCKNYQWGATFEVLSEGD